MNTFKHRGKLGDIIYSLNFVKAMGGGKLYLQIGEYLDNKGYEFLKPLLAAQSYITGVEVWSGQQVDYDLDRFREIMNNSHRRSLAESYFVVFGKTLPDNFQTEPWLDDPGVLFPGKIIINRVERGLHGSRPLYNPAYDGILKDVWKRCSFIGLIEEWQTFMKTFNQDRVECLGVMDALQMAQIINGAEYSVMNQSLPSTIVEGLKKPLYLEIRHDIARPDCMFDRSGLTYI